MVGRKASDVEFAEDAAEPLGSLQNPSDVADNEGSKVAHMEDLLLALAQPLVTSSADRCCNPVGWRLQVVRVKQNLWPVLQRVWVVLLTVQGLWVCLDFNPRAGYTTQLLVLKP
jgi:hypothetical protein